MSRVIPEETSVPLYAELHCVSSFSFLRGASHPQELVERAHALGYTALAITDECSVAGVVRAHLAARDSGLKLIVGTELALADGFRLVLLAPDRAAYGDLCELITQARCAAAKGSYRVTREDVAHFGRRCLALWLPPQADDEESVLEQAHWIGEQFPGRAWIAVELALDGCDQVKLDELCALGEQAGLPLVAAGDVHMHVRARRPLQDVLTAIRLGTTVEAAGFALHSNGERHLRSRAMLAKLYPPALLAETVRIAERCSFSLDELRYEYPEELVPAGETPASHLRTLTEAGLRRRYPHGAPDKVRSLIEHELRLIAELSYEPYFLTVHDLVAFARTRGILCQGRGSAANSAVCFALGITEVDPGRIETLFERFVSKERGEPPDIDVDFEHERREEVIQYLYAKYGRHRAALAATVISYRPKSAVRDVGKALGLTLEQVDRLAKDIAWWDGGQLAPERLKAAGFDPSNPRIRMLAALADELLGFPRHLSQHVGGFVIARERLSRLVPIENAAMPERTVIEWDKDDLDALGLLKVDVLGLGMLTAIRKTFGLVERARGHRLDMAAIPPEDPAVYAMIQRADTVGVFQIESRAQMAMLPRLKPACFYDLVIEVAIVRPGPIQGQMVHPYLRRRRGLEPVTYPSAAVRATLERTLGVPLFQEQVIKLAMVAAGFTPGEADRLRRAMAAWRRKGGLEPFERRLIEGMRARGYSETFARQIYQQIQGFGEYGFPECVAGETRVVDADSGRWLTIADVVNGRATLKHTLACDDDLRLRKRRVVAVRASGMKPVFRLRTALGHSIVASAEHPFLTVRGWQCLRDLKVGHFIAAARSLPFPRQRRWPRHYIIVLADLIAGGNLRHPGTFHFHTADVRYRDEFVNMVERFPNTRAVVKRHRGRFSVRVRRTDTRRPAGAVTWADEFGIRGRDARARHLPAEIFELRNADIALLLARLWEGDGGLSATGGHASYDTASRRLACDIQHLLLRLGIVARIYCRARRYRSRKIEHFVVTITGEEPLRLFARHVARRFLSPTKRRRAEALARRCTGGQMSRDIIPAEVREIIRRERDARGWTWTEIGRRAGVSLREIQGHGTRKTGFRRFIISRLAVCLRSRDLARLANSDLYWDKVVAIEAIGRLETYDLQIEGDHNFIADNLVVHNSHAASFALLAYVSAWLKHHEPAAFLAALLNSQPMGFYAASQLVQDARRHGVEVRDVDVRFSDWDCTLENECPPPFRGREREGVRGIRLTTDSFESGNSSALPVRLGLRMVKGLSAAGAARIITARNEAPFADADDLARRAALDSRDLEALAAAGALAGLAGHRHHAHWAVAGIEPELPLLNGAGVLEPTPILRRPTEGEEIVADYASLGLTLRRHPLALLRPQLAKKGYLSAAEVCALAHGDEVRTAGLVICRQHPASARGVIFVTIEDETGTVNLVVWQSVSARQRRELLHSRLLAVSGVVQREGEAATRPSLACGPHLSLIGEVLHVIAHRLADESALLGGLIARSRDFR